MASSLGSSPMQPLNVGNMVSAAFVLYRSHLKQYLGITWRATLWILLAFAGLSLPIGLAIAASVGGNSAVSLAGLAVLLAVLSIALLIYCSAKAQMNMALISRLAYGELVQQPEAVREARRELVPRTWRFFWAQVFVNLLLAIINFGLTIIQTIIIGIVSAVTSSESLISLLLALLLNLAAIIIYFWFYARWSIPELPIAIENLGSSDAVNRSWSLTKANSQRILTALFVAFLVTVPIYLLCFTPLMIAFFALLANLRTQDPMVGIGLLIGLGLSILLLVLLNVFILPFWQALKAVIYYDLRSRREGIDLHLRGR
jgi:hypothetical protein